MVREGRVFISSGSKPDFGSSYSVQALEVGAQVTSGSAGTTVTVRSGHGFAAGDKYMKSLDVTTYSGTLTIQSVTDTTLTLSSAYSVSAGDLLINLAADRATGATPNYDGNGLAVYTDMAYASQATNNTVATTSTGTYRYWHKGIAIWELVRTGTSLIALYTNASSATQQELNVMDFGAKGDGVADDYSAIQATYLAVPSTGSVVRFPPGTYLTSSDIVVKSYTATRGAGIGITTIRKKTGSMTASTDFDKAGIFKTGSSYGNYYTESSPGYSISWEDLTVDGNVDVFGALVAKRLIDYGFSFQGVDGVTVNRCEAKNFFSGGILAVNAVGISCRNVTVTNNFVSHVGRSTYVQNQNGITIGGQPTTTAWGRNVVVSGNHIRDVLYGEGISLQAVSDVACIGNTCDSCDFGIEYVTDAANVLTEFHNIVVSNNTITDCHVGLTEAGTGIAFNPNVLHTLHNVVISGNGIYNTTGAGIFIRLSIGVSISDNSLYNTNTLLVSAQDAGIVFRDCSEVVCSGNVIKFVTAAATIQGIKFLGVINGVLSDNVVMNPTAVCYLLVSDTGTQNTTNCLVTGNRAIGGTYSIRMTSPLTTSGNRFSKNYGTGFSVAEFDDSSTQLNYNNDGGFPVNIGTWGNDSATAGTDSTPTASFLLHGSIYIPANATVTGIQYLIGSVGGTDKVVVSLYSASGKLLANSATAGTTVGTLATAQKVPFTATYYALGPGVYHVGVNFNGTTCRVRTIPAGGNAGNGVSGKADAQTFGTPADFTPVLTFTADQIPIASIY